MGRELKKSTEIPRDIVIDKLMFYIEFLDTFTEKAENVLKEDDVQHLKMLREYIIDACALLKETKY